MYNWHVVSSNVLLNNLTYCCQRDRLTRFDLPENGICVGLTEDVTLLDLYKRLTENETLLDPYKI
jgi:hypothetical protein